MFLGCILFILLAQKKVVLEKKTNNGKEGKQDQSL
jgi:hypothetical protein